MRIEIFPEAFEEMQASARYYEVRQTGLGDRFIDDFENVCALILSFPEIGHPAGPPGVLQFSMSSFPHRVLYYVAGDALRLLAVSHHSRHPEHWKDRLGGSV